jgi:hypothetical protein
MICIRNFQFLKLQWFPGDLGNVELSDHVITFGVHEEGLLTIGLWARTGAVCHSKAIDSEQEISVQIGAHVESLLSQQGPWKR